MGEISQQQLEGLMIKAACKYLLYQKRQQPTQLRVAFEALVQERHNVLHTDGGHKEGNGTTYFECQNEICRNASAILDEEAEMRVELNKITTDMLDEEFALMVEKLPQRFFVYLLEKNKVKTPESNLIVRI